MPVVIQQAPQFTVEDAARLAMELYGLVAEPKMLPSYSDQNFLLDVVSGERFVLKIANATEDRAVLDLQQAALRYLAEHHPAIPVQRVVSTKTGDVLAEVEDALGTPHGVWLVTYLPGTLMRHVKPHNTELRHSLGGFLGRLDAALANFSHPAMHRVYAWDLKRVLDLRTHLTYIEDPARRALVEQGLALYASSVVLVLPELRMSVIHNDAHEDNVLMGVAGLGRHAVTGLIDFGDMVHTYTVIEPAIAAAYAMLDKPDPLAAAAEVVAGYHAAYPLSEQELAVLYPLIVARLCMSVLMSASRVRLEPDNEYLRRSERSAWAMLTYLDGVHPHFAHAVFRHACGLVPCPQAEPIRSWLTAHQNQLAPVVTSDPRTAPVVVFDFSVGSTEWEMLPLTQPMLAAEAISARLHETHAEIGIGRYDEPRLVYNADQFQDNPKSAARRTIHLGLDLFQPAGSPVFAPLDGTVHSFADNALPLDYGPTIILSHEPELGVRFYTLYGHLSRASLDGLGEGKAVCKGEQIGTLGGADENGGWVPHLHFQVITHMLGNAGDFPGVAKASERAVWLSLCPDPNLLVGVPAAAFPETPRSKAALREARTRHLGRNLSISYRKPLKIVRGFMQHLYDETGRAYLDAVNNVAHVGHSHPAVVRAAQRQMAVLNTNTRYLHDLLVRYAERLTATLPDPLSVCYFVNSGSEANDLALRLARTHTRRLDVVVLDGAYHGHLTSLIEISPYKFDGPGGMGAPPYVQKVAMPDPYRGMYRGEETGTAYARHVQEAIAAAGQNGDGVAAFIAESLLSCGGQIVLPASYLQAAYQAVREAGGVCIADEVQVGFGRVGSHWWGFETQEVVPDIVTMGKPIGNGHPLAAVVTTPEIAASFETGMEYFNTFGGNPVSCAVGLAVLDVIEAEGLQAHALRVGTYLMAGLERLQKKHPILGDVRGRGLFIGVELVLDRETLAPAAEQAAYIVNRMREEGILLSTDGPLHNVIKIKPPLVFSESDADLLVDTLDAVLDEDFAQPG